MNPGINKTLLIATLLTLPAWPLAAQSRANDPAERVVQDVVAFTLHRAAEELLRVSRIDPVYQGYSRHYVVRQAYDKFAFKTEREHDRFDQQRERILSRARV